MEDLGSNTLRRRKKQRYKGAFVDVGLANVAEKSGCAGAASPEEETKV